MMMRCIVKEHKIEMTKWKEGELNKWNEKEAKGIKGTR